MLDANELATLSELLLGAASADGSLDGREIETVKRLLRSMQHGDSLSPELEERMRSFDPEGLDVAAAAGKLAHLGWSPRLQVLGLICAVHEADNVVEGEENDYVEQVAVGMGLKPREYQHLLDDGMVAEVPNFFGAKG